MKTIRKAVFCCAILLILLLGIRHWYLSTYVEIESTFLKNDIAKLTLTEKPLPEADTLKKLINLRELDLRSIPVSIGEYEVLKANLPNCRILWNVPFQGSYLPENIKELSVSSLSATDFDSISYLPLLETVYASDCKDYDYLLQLKEEYPHLTLHYDVTIGGKDYRNDTVSLSLHNANLDELVAAIPYLPQLKQVDFTGTVPDYAHIYQLMCDYPHISFVFNLPVFGTLTPNTATELILSGILMNDTDDIESLLRYFPHLQRVEMCDCGIPSNEMDAMAKRWPQIRFVWTIHVGRGKVRTDAVGFIPWKFGYTGENPLYDRDCKELKYCIDLVCLDLGHMKIQDISFLEYMPNLKYLIVGELPCPDFSPIANLKELIYLEIFNVTFNQQEILLELPKLQDLNMGSTAIKTTAVLKQMTWLKRLWIAGTGLSFAQYDELVAALPNTQVVMHIPHSTAGGWRDHQNYRDMRDILGMFYMD